jgi:4-hydroxy-3-methylbut-2-enyl diphosphate reductase
LKDEGYVLLDATCDRIQLSQQYAAKFSAQGYRVIIAGEKNHDEIIGIAGFAQNPAIIENRVEAQEFASSPQIIEVKKTALIGQTTMSAEEYQAIAQLLTAAIPDIIVCDTICPITFQRQQALRELCAQVDGVLVVGGKNSANTRQLLAVAEAHCKNACLVESPNEIPPSFFELDRVGLTAGASTPDEAIDAVETALTSQ